jgi:hypothetical protein
LAAVWNRKPRGLLRKCEMFVLVALKGCLTLEIKTISFTNCSRAGIYIFGDYLTTAGVEYCREQAA